GRQAQTEVPLRELQREQLRIARTNRVHEVLVMRVLRARRHERVAPTLLVAGRRVGSRPFLVLVAEVRLPLAAVAVDPEPSLRAVKEVADPLRALVVG